MHIWLTFINILGSLGLFIYGMKIMSEAIQRAAENRLREILKSMAKNKLFALLTGIIITSIVQSSSATTVMIVSFVNAGLLTLTESVGIIMGANIGTTIKAWMVSWLGFGAISISAYCLPILAIGFPMLFIKKVKNIGEILFGFALLFLGLDLLKNSMPDFEEQASKISALSQLFELEFLNTLLFILGGTLITLIIQSSSAVLALTLTLCHNGLIPIESAIAMVLGENIGTTVTAHLSAIVANVHAKRAAWVHTLFNVLGVFWMIFIVKSVTIWLDEIIVQDFFNLPSAFINTSAQPILISAFHTGFNIANTIIFIWFDNLFVKLSTWIVPSKGKKDEQHHLEYLPMGIVAAPELSLVESKKEVAKFADITHRMLHFYKSLLTNIHDEEIQQIIHRIKKYEDITDTIEVEIVTYLIKTAENELTEYATKKLRAQLSIVRDLERIGDILFQMTKVYERKREDKIWFTPEQRNNLLYMIDLIDEAFNIMKKNIEAEDKELLFDEALNIEEKINAKRDEMKTQHWISIENKDYDIKSGFIYNDLFSSMEKIGDQIMNVSEALAGKI